MLRIKLKMYLLCYKVVRKQLKSCDKRTMGNIFGPKLNRELETGEYCIMRSFIICTLHQTLLG